MADSSAASPIPVAYSSGDPPSATPVPVPGSDLPAAPAAKSEEASPAVPVIDPSKEERMGSEHPLPGASADVASRRPATTTFVPHQQQNRAKPRDRDDPTPADRAPSAGTPALGGSSNSESSRKPVASEYKCSKLSKIPKSRSWSLVRSVRLAIQGNMRPVMPSDERSSAMTRWGSFVLQVIPCHLQNSMDALLHEDKTSAEPASWDPKQRSACRSLSVSLLLMTNGRRQKNFKI
uniref:Uncharacterized protein n=1 Tax=Oryza glumipatula TaxID=40148 RepID=A0A0E0ABB9_9ORYZ